MKMYIDDNQSRKYPRDKKVVDVASYVSDSLIATGSNGNDDPVQTAINCAKAIGVLTDLMAVHGISPESVLLVAGETFQSSPPYFV